MTDVRDKYLGRVVKGKSFADVGGLWGTVNEKVTVAHWAGARALAMVDVTVPGAPLWQAFERRLQQFGIAGVECVSDDVIALASRSPCHQYDVVHCSGVLYHVPNPLALLVALRRITREYLVLGSVVTATRVKSAAGVLEVPDAAALFVPALRRQERAVLEAYWRPVVGDGAWGVTADVAAWSCEDFAPWWWLPTPTALKAMCEVAGFRCEDSAFSWGGNTLVQLLAVGR